MVITRETKGEFALLAVFAAFVIGFLLDVRGLPLDGKLLAYMAGPAALILVIVCAFHSVRSRKQTQAADEEDAGPDAEAFAQRTLGRRRLLFTAGTSVFLFLSIWMVGFYFGTGLMMLVWFLCLKRLSAGTAAVTVVLPALLYLAFEIVFDMGLPKGEVLKLLAG